MSIRGSRTVASKPDLFSTFFQQGHIAGLALNLAVIGERDEFWPVRPAGFTHPLAEKRALPLGAVIEIAALEHVQELHAISNPEITGFDGIGYWTVRLVDWERGWENLDALVIGRIEAAWQSDRDPEEAADAVEVALDANGL